MIDRIAKFGLMLCVFVAPLASELRAQEPLREFSILFVERAGDPLYQLAAGYAGLYRSDHFSPYPAAQLAINDSAVAARARGMRLTLERTVLTPADNAVEQMRSVAKANNFVGAILDLPIEDTIQISQALKEQPLVLFNPRHRSDGLRKDTCRTRLLHTLPSWSMLHDGLAQRLLELNWRRILVLQGPLPADKVLASSFMASARKFGLSIVGERNFTVGNDPRKRDQINIRLLTAGLDHDVIFVAEDVGDFSRTVPFNTARPRPVVGPGNLEPSAWHSYWERNGAPQLNRRFFRLAGRQMRDEDWATWISIRSILDVLAGTSETSGAGIFSALLDPARTIELYKGTPGSFRSWSHQLRQPILLGTHNAVVGLAPVDGTLHQKNNLDTLGQDEPEFRCDR